ncbi:DUF2909 domain-containing protein [Litoribrevibacter euphylliae]|uniref:DUF2909 domain-containing protein n=1 Tax=Litoribrevibacter euphylliae TaxID=1834034 RepID=A0ABV7H7K6_9GAMM
MIFKFIIVVMLLAVVISLFWSFWHLVRHPQPGTKVLKGLALRVLLSAITLLLIFLYLGYQTGHHW